MEMVSSGGCLSRVTITRPANVTPYTAGDVVGGAVELPNLGRFTGYDVLVNSAALMPCIAAIPAGMTSFRLQLYSQTPPSAIADNGVWDLPAGDRAVYQGYIDLGSPADVGSTLFCQVTALAFQTRLAAQSTSLWGYLVTNGAYTPAANSEDYVLMLGAMVV